MTTYQCLTVLISVANLIVLGFTLWKLFQYTQATRDQVKASLEQVEALQKPYLTIEWEELPPEDQGLAILKAQHGVGPIILGIVAGNAIKIKNIGSGPALSITYCLRRLEPGEEVRFSKHFIPHLPNEGFQTDVDRNQIVSIGEVEFVIEYKSLRNKPYETRITIRPEDFMRTRRLVITDIKSTPPHEN